MARLLFCDYHNMIAILEKGEHNTDFHHMVDFIEASPLRYALMVKPTVYVSHIRQFWSTARIETTEEGTKILATVDDEPASPVRDDSQGEACPTDSDFIADKDMATIAKSSTLPHDSVPRVTSHAAEEGNEGEAATERVSDDTKEMETVLTLMDTATVLASRVVDVPTDSGSISTASTPAKGSVPTGSLVFTTATVVTPVTRRKGKEIARDAEIARIHAEEELQSMIDGLDSNNETVAKYLEEYRQFSSELPLERRIELISDLVKDFRGMTFEEVEAKFNSVCKQMEDFIPMGSKEEAEKIKRKGINLEQESAKKQKSSEEITEKAKSPKEVPEEKVKEMMNLVPIEERLVKETLSTRPPTSDKDIELWVELSRLYEPDEEDQLWTHTQNFMHAPVDWKLYDSCGVHHVAANDKEIFMLVEKDYPLRKGLALVMICYKLQVKNFSQMENELVLMIYRIANSPRQQGEDCWNKIHKAFPLPVIKFPLAEEVPTASVKGCHCQKKCEATARKIALLC
nr:hypothetical protein [Tanacetum cinerariifolium]